MSGAGGVSHHDSGSSSHTAGQSFPSGTVLVPGGDNGRGIVLLNPSSQSRTIEEIGADRGQSLTGHRDGEGAQSTSDESQPTDDDSQPMSDDSQPMTDTAESSGEEEEQKIDSQDAEAHQKKKLRQRLLSAFS